MDDVAHHAGVGVGTAYRHFANKYDLAGRIFENTVHDLLELAEQSLKAADPWEGLVTYLELTLEAQTHDRALREIITGIHDDDRDRQHGRLDAPFVTLVEHAKAEGAIRPEVRPSDVSLILVMLCTITDACVEQSPYLWRRYLPTLLDGLRPGGAPMPVTALSGEQLREALTPQKRRPLLRRVD
jgi:AcrR family transcriptional regulator